MFEKIEYMGPEKPSKIAKPSWLKVRLEANTQYAGTSQIVAEHKLHTICESGKCPNIGECWSRGTASFMIGGDICTRSCGFCATKIGRPHTLDLNEPVNVANSIKLMGVKYCVITSVNRDDLPDEGAEHWFNTIRKVKELNPSVGVEVLIPDFHAKANLIQRVLDAKPDVVSHNLETVRRLTPEVRSHAKYDVSLDTLRYVAKAGVTAKSSIMLGLGETAEEVYELMDDLIGVGCNIMTLGQYLQPSFKHLRVQEYVTPEKFEHYKSVALSKGFKYVESGPLVRSSYFAERAFYGLQ